MRYTHRHKKMAIDGASESNIHPNSSPFEEIEEDTSEPKESDEKALKRTKPTYTKIETAMSSFDDNERKREQNDEYLDSSNNNAEAGSPRKIGGLYKKLSTHAKHVQRK